MFIKPYIFTESQINLLKDFFKSLKINPTQIKILILYIQTGWGAKKMSESLFVSYRTVETQLYHAYRKLRIGKRGDIFKILPWDEIVKNKNRNDKRIKINDQDILPGGRSCLNNLER